ncbi:MAG: hypothetical protein QGG40_04850 [Myxococcota bacterium]|jgi:tetratricopeptide (TPR) repeat protein|nr:hypothetical protein [Myxococcota bacterium]
MYNLAISFLLGTLCFGIGWVVAGNWVAGFVPALLGLVICYISLARRTGRKLQALAELAAKEFQQGRLANGRRILEKGLDLGRWQFLVESQIHAQLGAIDYMQRDWKAARSHLEQAWSRNWMAQGMLAAIDHRQGRRAQGLERLAGSTGPGKKEAAFWGLYAWMHLENGERDKALEVLNRGLEKLPDSGALKSMAQAVRNKRKVKMKAFAPTWYQLFPEHMPKKAMMAHAANRPGAWPQPRR